MKCLLLSASLALLLLPGAVRADDGGNNGGNDGDHRLMSATEMGVLDAGLALPWALADICCCVARPQPDLNLRTFN